MAVLIAGMQGAGLKGLAAANSVKNTKGSGSSDFGAMLTSNVSRQGSSQDSARQAKSEPVAKQDGVSLAAREEGVSDAALTAKQPEETAAFASEPEKGGEAEESLQAEAVEEVFRTMEADGLDTAVKEILAGIKSAVKDVLQLDEEEFNLLLEQMGIVVADLLNPQVLQQFVVEAGGGEDISVLLADESMYGNLRQLQETIENIVQESGMPKEEIARQAAQLQAPVLQEQEIAAEEIPEEKLMLSDTKASDLETVAEAARPEESTFHFEAVRESGEDARQEGGTQERDSGARVSQPEQFLNLMADAVSENQDGAEVQFSQLSAAEQLREIADQILEKVRVIISPSQTSMEITLNPESLGRVSLNLISKQGVMTAQFTAQNQVAREAIESQITVLRENLENQGLKVDAIEVTVSNFEFTQSDGMAGQEQQGGRPQQRRNIHIEEAGFLDEVTEEEALAIDILERSGNSVDYTA